jgi:hypothetical protein
MEFKMRACATKTVYLLLIIFLLLYLPSFAGWSFPVRISEPGTGYYPQIISQGDTLHAIYQNERQYSKICYVRSVDGGATWSQPLELFDRINTSSPWFPQIISYGGGLMALWQVYVRDGNDHNNIACRISSDDGNTWSPPEYVLSGNRYWPFFLTASGSSSLVNMMISWGYADTTYYESIRSTDFGQNWLGPIRAFTCYQGLANDQASLGEDVFFTRDSRYDPSHKIEIYWDHSSDGGVHWSDYMAQSDTDQYHSQLPAIDINNSGMVGVTWMDYQYAQYMSTGDIFLRLSPDSGNTWTPEIQITNNHYAFRSDIVLEGDTIAIAWEDSRPENGWGSIYCTRSTDGGQSWSEQDWVDNNRNSSSNPALAAANGKVYLIWEESGIGGDSSGLYFSKWEDGNVPPDSSVPQLQMIGSCQLPNWFDFFPNVCVDGNYAYIGGSSQFRAPQITAIDISNPSNPNLINAFDTTHMATEIVASDNYAYYSWYDHGGLVTYDVSDPSNPVFASEVFHGGDSRGLCKRDSLIYLVNMGSMVIYNVANPNQPQLLATFDSTIAGYGLNDIDVSNGIACLIAPREIFIVDVSDPAHPELRSRFAIDDAMRDGLKVAVKLNVLYIITYTPSVEIVDISDPSHPTHIRDYLMSYGNAYNLCIHGNLLLVAHNDITVADISDPLHPHTIAEYTGLIPFYDVDADDEYIYGNGEATFGEFELPTTGINLDEAKLPQKSILSQNYPNPFNSSTSIGYNLPKASDITLAIFDILGRRVATLVDGHQAAGHHEVIWNASRYSSGIYFARASSNNNSSTIKLIYLR